MIIFGIETSCDETAAAVVKDGTKVLSNVVASSQELHKKYGGIIPESAAREQAKCIIPVIEEAVKSSKLKIENLDALAVTVEPGLIGSLLIGVETAKTLSFALKKPLVPVNHLIAHIYANFIHQPSAISHQQSIFPVLSLVASGGHTELLLMKSHQNFKWLGGTRDDAAGECFDKCARLLGLGYPGGPAIEASASKFKVKSLKLKVKLPRPMIHQDNFDFSFAGLKTAVARLVEKKKLPTTYLAYEIQEAITDCLVTKTLKAAEKLKPKSILISGGVAANGRLREKFQFAIRQLENLGIKLFIPEKKYCTDNAVVVASRAFFNFKPMPWRKVKANPSLGEFMKSTP